MEMELGDSFWRSFSGLAPDSHSSFHRDGSNTGEDKVKRITKVSCHVDCGPDPVLEVTVWSVWSWTLCDAGTCWNSRGYYSESVFHPKIRGSAVFHTSLCFLESASERQLQPSCVLTPHFLLELSLKQLRQSGIDCLAISVSLVLPGGQVERETGFC